MTAVDLTLLRDPAAIWPEPGDCPDWPLMTDGNRGAQNRPGLEQAEARLADLMDILNPKDTPTRAPTKAEAETLTVQHFTKHEPQPGENLSKIQRWTDLGFAGFRPAGGMAGDKARMIAEGVHIRGYLRKLEALKAQSETLTTARAERRLKARVAGYTGLIDDHMTTLTQLAEAEARHLQMIEDRRAHERCIELRRTLRIRHADAIVAAAELGVDVPVLPDMRHDPS